MPVKADPARALGRGLLLLALAALPLAATAEEVVRSFPAGSRTVLEMRNLSGRVEIRSWNQRQVRVVAQRQTRAVETHFEETPNQIHVHTHLLQSAAPASERVVNYEIWAPPDVSINLRQDAGTVMIENFAEDVNVETVAAQVELRNVSGHTLIETLNGTVVIWRGAGRTDATSISGNLHFLEMDTRNLVARTTSGDIYYEGAFRPGGSYEFVNHQGSIELRVPANASFELNANSVKGEVSSEFPLTPRSHGRVPRTSVARSLLGTVHTGEAMVRVTSFSGTIRLRKR
jgi:hypothetical protein